MENRALNKQPLRVLFITQDDPFYIWNFFNEFFKQTARNIKIVAVVNCPSFGNKSKIALLRRMLRFYGMRDFCRMLFRYIAAKLRKQTVRNLCEKYGIPYLNENNINGPGFIAYCREKEVDVIQSVAAPIVFKSRLLNAARWGCLNIHHAKLPQYRGMMPNFWQMLNDEPTVWITIHRMDKALDRGHIILQNEIPLQPAESLDSLIKRTKRLGSHCVAEAFSLIRSGKVKLLEVTGAGSYYSFPASQDIRNFRKKGKRLL